MRVLEVAQQVLVTARVVQADDGRTRERRTTEREQVLGRVVEQHTDVASVGDAPAASTSRKRFANRWHSATYSACVHVRSPNLHRGAVAVGPGRSRCAQQRGRVGRGHRRLTGRGRNGCAASATLIALTARGLDRDRPISRPRVLRVRPEGRDEARQ